MLPYPSTVALSTRTLNYLADSSAPAGGTCVPGGDASTPANKRC